LCFFFWKASSFFGRLDDTSNHLLGWFETLLCGKDTLATRCPIGVSTARNNTLRERFFLFATPLEGAYFSFDGLQFERSNREATKLVYNADLPFLALSHRCPVGVSTARHVPLFRAFVAPDSGLYLLLAVDGDQHFVAFFIYTTV
jgi:hypothetical protein